MTPQLQAQIAERKAEIVAFLHKDTVSTIEPVSRKGNLPLSFAQARLWFLDKLQPDSAFYNIPIVWRLSGKLNVAALQSSLNEIICRHEALRTNFVTQEEQPVQVIASTLSLKLEIVDLLYLPQGEREVEMQRLVTTEAVQPFDLEREPLVRATLLQLGSTESVFVLTAHHTIFDGWSTGVFVQELATLYTAFSTNTPPPKNFLNYLNYPYSMPTLLFGSDSGSNKRGLHSYPIGSNNLRALPLYWSFLPTNQGSYSNKPRRASTICTFFGAK